MFDGALYAIALIGLTAILVPTLLKVFGVIGGDTSGTTPTTGGGGVKGDPAAPVVKDYTLPKQNPNKPVTVDVPSVFLAAADSTVDADPRVDNASVVLTSSDTGDTSRLTVFQKGFFKLDLKAGKLTFNPVA